MSSFIVQHHFLLSVSCKFLLNGVYLYLQDNALLGQCICYIITHFAAVALFLFTFFGCSFIDKKVEIVNHRELLIQDKYIEKYLRKKALYLAATLDAKEAYRMADFVIIATPTNYHSAT